MIANRIILSCFFFIATLSLLVYAAPVARSDDSAILAILLDLQVWLKVKLALFDGVTDPTSWADEIVAKIAASVTLILAVDVNVADTASIVAKIVAIVLDIIASLGTAAAKYGVVIAAALSVKFGLSITLLVDAIIKVIPSTAGALGSWA